MLGDDEWAAWSEREIARSPFPGRDPVALILSLNIARRHMTKGQTAIARAANYRELKILGVIKASGRLS
jgi:hypothetical protein